MTDLFLFALLVIVALLVLGTLAIPLILWWANRERERHPDQYAAWVADNPLPHSPAISRASYIVWDAHASTLRTENDVNVDTTEADNNAINPDDSSYRDTSHKHWNDWHPGWTRSRDSVGAGRRSSIHRR